MEQGRRMACLLLVLWVVSGFYRSEAYLPVIVLHGIFADSGSMSDLVSLIESAHPGTRVYNLDGYDDILSMLPMWEQVDYFRKIMLPIFENSTNEGVNMICFSQGGLTCRGVLETTPNHTVKNFISLSSPQGGQFGDTMYLNYSFLLPNFTKEHMYTFFYSPPGQEIAIGNYWKDPHHMKEYEKDNKFLPILNTPTKPEYRTSFMKLDNIVLIGGPDDGVVTPWQSSHFAFFDDKEEILELEDQEYYLNDSFGLKTLDSTGKLHVHKVPGVQHTHWHGNEEVFTCCIEPYLK